MTDPASVPLDPVTRCTPCSMWILQRDLVDHLRREHGLTASDAEKAAFNEIAGFELVHGWGERRPQAAIDAEIRLNEQLARDREHNREARKSLATCLVIAIVAACVILPFVVQCASGEGFTYTSPAR